MLQVFFNVFVDVILIEKIEYLGNFDPGNPLNVDPGCFRLVKGRFKTTDVD